MLELAHSVESTIQCPKCKNRKVMYREQQTRSADEGMTCICVCTQCHHSFTLKS
jgi:DNA-directed RNA polymerase subunit M/transcription elongation factor TFIIS